MARDNSHQHVSVGRCFDCGKFCYVTKDDARRARRRVHPGDSMSEYPCGQYWHYGHSHKIHGSVIAELEPLPPLAISQIHAMGKAVV